MQSQTSNIKVMAGWYFSIKYTLYWWYIIDILWRITRHLFWYLQDGFTVPVVEIIETSKLLPKFPMNCSVQDTSIAHSKVEQCKQSNGFQSVLLQISRPFPGDWGASTPLVMITLLISILLLTSLSIKVNKSL